MSLLTRQLFLTHRRQISIAASPTLSIINIPITKSSSPIVLKSYNYYYHTSAPLNKPGYKPPRNPKIGITLEQLRMAARGTGRRLPICHDEMEKVMNSLEAAKYEVCLSVLIHDVFNVYWCVPCCIGCMLWCVYCIMMITKLHWCDDIYLPSFCRIMPYIDISRR